MQGRAAFEASDRFSGARRTAAALSLAASMICPVGGAWAADKAPAAASVGDNIRSFGQQVTDPNSLTRIKTHEQEFEKHVETTRDHQRKDHGAARASDATELATKPSPGGASATSKRKAGAPTIKKTDDAKRTGNAKAAAGTGAGKEAATPPAAVKPAK